MIVTTTPAEARRKTVTSTSHGDTITFDEYIGGDGTRTRGPQAFRIGWPAGHVSRPHFHGVDQFQIFVDGGATLGKHSCDPVTLHYADAFTPYGPIIVGNQGSGFYNLRNHGDTGAHYMPGSKHEMPRSAGRGLTAHCRLTLDGDTGPMRYEALLGPYDDGLGAYEVVSGPTSRLIDVVAGGTGRYQLVLEGSVVLNGEELGPGSVTFVSPGDFLANRCAGGEGVHLLEVQFPTL